MLELIQESSNFACREWSNRAIPELHWVRAKGTLGGDIPIALTLQWRTTDKLGHCLQ